MGSFAGSDPKTKADPATGNDSELMLPFVGLPLFGEIWNKKFSKEVWKGNERYIMVYIYIYTIIHIYMFAHVYFANRVVQWKSHPLDE